MSSLNPTTQEQSVYYVKIPCYTDGQPNYREFACFQHPLITKDGDYVLSKEIYFM